RGATRTDSDDFRVLRSRLARAEPRDAVTGRGQALGDVVAYADLRRGKAVVRGAYDGRLVSVRVRVEKVEQPAQVFVEVFQQDQDVRMAGPDPVRQAVEHARVHCEEVGHVPVLAGEQPDGLVDPNVEAVVGLQVEPPFAAF